MDVSAATKVHDTVQTTLSLEHATDAVTLSFNAFVNDKLQLREQLARTGCDLEVLYAPAAASLRRLWNLASANSYVSTTLHREATKDDETHIGDINLMLWPKYVSDPRMVTREAQKEAQCCAKFTVPFYCGPNAMNSSYSKARAAEENSVFNSQCGKTVTLDDLVEVIYAPKQKGDEESDAAFALRLERGGRAEKVASCVKLIARERAKASDAIALGRSPNQIDDVVQLNVDPDELRVTLYDGHVADFDNTGCLQGIYPLSSDKLTLNKRGHIRKLIQLNLLKETDTSEADNAAMWAEEATDRANAAAEWAKMCAECDAERAASAIPLNVVAEDLVNPRPLAPRPFNPARVRKLATVFKKRVDALYARRARNPATTRELYAKTFESFMKHVALNCEEIEEMASMDSAGDVVFDADGRRAALRGGIDQSAASAKKFLGSLGMATYSDKFDDEGYETIDHLAGMSGDEMHAELGMNRCDVRVLLKHAALVNAIASGDHSEIAKRTFPTKSFWGKRLRGMARRRNVSPAFLEWGDNNAKAFQALIADTTDDPLPTREELSAKARKYQIGLDEQIAFKTALPASSPEILGRSTGAWQDRMSTTSPYCSLEEHEPRNVPKPRGGGRIVSKSAPIKNYSQLSDFTLQETYAAIVVSETRWMKCGGGISTAAAEAGLTLSETWTTCEFSAFRLRSIAAPGVQRLTVLMMDWASELCSQFFGRSASAEAENGVMNADEKRAYGGPEAVEAECAVARIVMGGNPAHGSGVVGQRMKKIQEFRGTYVTKSVKIENGLAVPESLFFNHSSPSHQEIIDNVFLAAYAALNISPPPPPMAALMPPPARRSVSNSQGKRVVVTCTNVYSSLILYSLKMFIFHSTTFSSKLPG